ncbi:MAG: hypothetical protein AB1295_06110 [Candidatus Micrarchaeota archaeon]
MAGVQIDGKGLLKVRVRGEPKNLVVLRGNGSTRLFEAHPLVDGFNAENGTKLKVVSHQVADVACTVGEMWVSLPAFAVDASIAYEAPGNRLGKEIVFSVEGEPKVVLATGKYKGERDVALVALGLSSTDFKKDGKSIVLDISEDRLILVPNFPGPDGWYVPHEQTGVPQSNEVESVSARYLYRLNGFSYVGLLVRGGKYFYCRQDVDANYRASVGLGVVAEVPEGDAAKIEALLKPVEAPKSQVDAQVLAQLKEFLSAMGKARF